MQTMVLQWLYRSFFRDTFVSPDYCPNMSQSRIVVVKG